MTLDNRDTIIKLLEDVIIAQDNLVNVLKNQIKSLQLLRELDKRIIESQYKQINNYPSEIKVD